MPFILFEYLYRDAGNYKAFGSVALDGGLNADELSALRSAFPGDGLFIAEQLGIPPLYEQLYQWSGGPTEADHCWHTFLDARVVADGDSPPEAHRGGAASTFFETVVSIDKWEEQLSPHFWQEPMLAALAAEAKRL